MNEPGLDPNTWSWLPGTVYGTFVGLLGAVSGTLAALGKAKQIVLGLWMLAIVGGIIILAAGVIAYLAGQPYGVWYGLGLAGLIGTIVTGSLFPVMLLRYRQAEELAAKDIS